MAHHRATGGAGAGLSIPSLTHGQMAIVARFREAILALADAEPQPDLVARKLRNYAAMEHSLCFWGVMPGSVADETSPFNACAHAEFAAVRALLAHLEALPHTSGAARAITVTMDREIDARADPFILCRYSDEPFNTAEVIGPDWSALTGHGPTLLTLLAGVALATGAVAAAGAMLGAHGQARPAHRTR